MMKIVKRVKKGKFSKLSRIEKDSWIDLENPTQEEIKEVMENLKIPVNFMRASLDPEEVPRVEKENNTVLLILRLPKIIKSENGEEIETITLGIIIKDNYFVTIHREEIPFFKEFLERKVKRFYTDKRTRLLLQIIFKTIQYFIQVSKKLQIATEEAERELFYSIEAEDIIKIWRIRQSIVYLHDAVIGNGKVLEAILKGRAVKLYKTDQEIIEDLIIENNQLTRIISLMTELMASTMDAYASLINNNLNVVMKRLSSLAIILSIPVTVSSIYGMNIKLPLQTNPNAFWILMISSFIVSFLILIVFRKIKWM